MVYMQASNFTSLISPLQDTHLPYDHMWPTFQQCLYIIFELEGNKRFLQQ